MLHLRTFGVVSLQRREPADLDVPTPRRTLAVLALLAASDTAGVARDRIAAMLWPESDDEAARNSLRQTLYQLKQAAGVAVITGSNELRLDSATITTDVGAFRHAIASKNCRAAIALYRGPFLDGFYRRGSEAFEHWIDAVRQELALQHRRALQQLAEEASSAKRFAEETEYRRQLCVLDPYDSRFALQYMSALAKSGNPSEALRYYVAHEQALRAELSVAPSPDVSALASRLRQPQEATISSDAARDIVQRQNETSPLVVPSIPSSSPASLPVQRRNLTAYLQASVFIAAAVVAIALLFARRPAPSDSAGHGTVYVDLRPAEPNGVNVVLERSLASMIAARLHGVEGVMVSADSTDGGISSVRDLSLSLRAVTLGSAVRLLIEGGSNEPAHTAALDIPGDSLGLPALADRAAYGLLPLVVRRSLKDATNRASRSTTSLTALKSFVAAEAKVHDALFPAAMQLLDSAVQADSQFAYAFHRLAEVADWNGRTAEMLAASRRAEQLAATLTEDDRLLISSVVAWRLGDVDAAERGLRRLVTGYPNDIEGWYFLGEVQFHSAPLRGRDFTRARQAFEQVKQAGTRRRDVTIHLSRIAMKLGDRAAAESVIWVGETTDRARAGHERQPYQLMDTTTANLRRLEQTLRASNSESLLWEVVDRGAVYSENVRGAAHIARVLRSAPSSVETRRAALLYAAALEAAGGRYRTADSMLAHSDDAPPDRFVFFRAVLATAPYSTLAEVTLRMLHDNLVRWAAQTRLSDEADANLNALAPRYAAPFIGALALRLGHGANEAVPTRLAAEPNIGDDLAALDRAYNGWLRGQRELARGNPAAALRYIVENEPQITLASVKSLLGTYAPIRWLRAELLRMTGGMREAQQWYDAIVSTSALETPYLAPAHLRSAQIFEQLGDSESALRHYRAFVTIWRECEPELRPMVDSAREHIKKLERAIIN